MALSLGLTQNKTGVYFLSVYQSDGVTPQPLAGLTLWFHADYEPGGFVIDKSSPSSGITIDNIAGGTDCATLTINPADTTALALTPEAIAAMDCELNLVTGAGASFELDRGTLTVTGNVGLP